MIPFRRFLLLLATGTFQGLPIAGKGLKFGQGLLSLFLGTQIVPVTHVVAGSGAIVEFVRFEIVFGRMGTITALATTRTHNDICQIPPTIYAFQEVIPKTGLTNIVLAGLK